LNINDKDFSEFLIGQIKDIIKKEKIKEQIVKEWPGTVVAVGTGTADVKIAGDTTTILLAMKNKTNVVLNIGDSVYVHSPTGNLTNSWITVKF
jgi:uridylate kinase